MNDGDEWSWWLMAVMIYNALVMSATLFTYSMVVPSSHCPSILWPYLHHHRYQHHNKVDYPLPTILLPLWYDMEHILWWDYDDWWYSKTGIWMIDDCFEISETGFIMGIMMTQVAHFSFAHGIVGGKQNQLNWFITHQPYDSLILVPLDIIQTKNLDITFG